MGAPLPSRSCSHIEPIDATEAHSAVAADAFPPQHGEIVGVAVLVTLAISARDRLHATLLGVAYARLCGFVFVFLRPE